MGTEREGIALLYGNGAPFERGALEELRHHIDSASRGYNLHLGVLCHDLGDIAGMVGLHVVNHQVVGLALAKGIAEILPPLLALALIHRIHNGHLIVEDKVGVVRDTVRHYILTFEQVNVGVVNTYVKNCIRDICLHSH